MSDQPAVRAVPRLRWFRILPPIILVYVINWVDRANIAFAMPGGMNAELGLTASVAGVAAGIFFVGYLVLQIPGGHFAARHSAKHYVTGSMIAWGIVVVGTGFAQNAWQILAIRFLLGVAEGGSYPAMLVLIANWFPREEIGRANSVFMCGGGLANFIVGPISGTIISLFGWRSVFYVEGLLPFLVLLVWLPLISERPETATWLSAEERDYIVPRLRREQEAIGGRTLLYREIAGNPNLWKLAVIYFALMVGSGSYIFWLPTILRTLTGTGIAMVGLLSALPYLLLMLGTYVFGWLSDRTGDRRLFMAIPFVGFAVTLILTVLTSGTPWVSYIFLALAGGLATAQIGIFWTAPAALFPREMAGGVRGSLNMLGNIGGFAGPAFCGWMISTFNSSSGALCGLAILPVIALVVVYLLPSALSHQIRG